jgi:branched-chain amino acid transport system ATP-binding protein
LLEVEKVDAYYGEIQVLRETSITVKDGELIAIFGPNGHGKSTLLKTICGLHPSASGHIKFNGIEIDNLPSHKIVEMGLVYVAEDRRLFPEMTVMENLKMGAYNINAREKEGKNIDYVYQLFPRLAERKNQLARTLSGGEARMLAIGRGVMSSAKFLVLDEPTLGLAPNTSAEVFRTVTEINKDGVSIILVEQSVVHASELADRIYLLEDGRIVFEGSKEEALSNEHVKAVFLGV